MQQYWKKKHEDPTITKVKVQEYFLYLYRCDVSYAIFKATVYAVKHFEDLQRECSGISCFKDMSMISQLLKWSNYKEKHKRSL